MIICDGKHDKQVEGFANANVRKQVEVGKDTIILNFNASVPGKHYCLDCLADRVDKIDIAQLIRE